MYRETWETLIHTNIDTNKDGRKNWCKVLNVRWTGKGYRNWTSSKRRNCGHLKIMWRGVYHRGNQKIYQKFQHLFKANLILLANAPTPGQCTDSWPCPASRRVATCRPIAFCSWSTEPTSRKHSCNNIQIGRFTPANAQAMKFANYLHLQTEQLLKIFLGKTIDNYWEDNTIKYYLKYVCSDFIDKLSEKCQVSVLVLYYNIYFLENWTNAV